MKKNTLLLGLILTSLAGVVSADEFGVMGDNGTYYLKLTENKSYVNVAGCKDVNAENGTKVEISAGSFNNISGGVHGDPYSVKGDISVVFANATSGSWLNGGNYYSTGIVDGNIDIQFKSGSVHGIRGGSLSYEDLFKETGKLATVKGNVNVDISGGTLTSSSEEAFSAAGSYANIDGDLTLTVSGDAKINGDIYGGSGRTITVLSGKTAAESVTYMRAENAFADDEIIDSVNHVKINIKGGDIQASVYGGAMKYSAVKSTEINISGGSIEKNVYAGGGEAGSGKYTIVRNDANINISGGVVKGNVYASGSNDTAKVLGTSTVTLTNNAKVEGTIHGRTLGSAEDGAKVLNFGTVANEQNVAFNGKVNVANFDTINVEGNSNAEIGTYQALEGGTTINIASGSTLTLNLAGNVFSSTSLENAGSLVLNKGSYTGDTVEFKAYNANGGTVYGGWFDGSTLNFGTKTEKESSAISADAPAIVQKAETLVIADKSEEGKSDASMKVNQVSISASSNENANVVVNNAEVVDFTVDTFSATGMDEVAMENILTVWTFDIEGVSEENGVVLSFVVGEGFDINTSKIWHRSDETGKWEDVSGSVSGLTYDGNTLSFIATEFSDYSLTTTNVPEPAEWAAIFGAIALGFVIYRRRK